MRKILYDRIANIFVLDKEPKNDTEIIYHYGNSNNNI